MADDTTYELKQVLPGPMHNHADLTLTGTAEGVAIEYEDGHGTVRTLTIAHSQTEELKRFSDACDRVSRTI